MREPTEPELDARERAALAAWTPRTPPAGFADRVLAARGASPRRARWPVVVGGLAAVVAAAGVAVVVMREPSRSARGDIVAMARVETTLGTRGIAVAERDAVVRWTIAADGAARIDQPSGNVFYRVERGGPFVVHTPAGDIHVTGTCFRVEVTPMNTKHVLLSGTAGAALAAAVVITVYEGRVIADTKTSKTELVAGTRATLDGSGTRIVPAAAGTAMLPGGVRGLVDDRDATREELLARATQQRALIGTLEARIKLLESGGEAPLVSPPEAGRAWFEPSAEQLQQFAAECRIRVDEPDLGSFQPLPLDAKIGNGATPADITAYNTALGELAKQWAATVRALYIEATGDVTGAESLSIDAMRNEIREKSPPGEANVILQKLSAERAGLQPPPADLSTTSPLERLTRANLKLGDQAEEALAKQLGPERARELRGEGWGSRNEWSGCPKSR